MLSFSNFGSVRHPEAEKVAKAVAILRKRDPALVVDGGRFDWGEPAKSAGKFPTLTEPYAGFHDMVFVDESTTAAFLLRARREGIRDFCACMAPMAKSTLFLLYCHCLISTMMPSAPAATEARAIGATLSRLPVA